MNKSYVIFIFLSVIFFNVHGKNINKNGVLYSLDENTFTATITGGVFTELTEVDIPNFIEYNNHFYEVTSVKKGSFENNDNLGFISLPSTIRTIEDDAFHACSNLSSIIINSRDVKYDGYNIFGMSGFNIGGLKCAVPEEAPFPLGFENAFGSSTLVRYPSNALISEGIITDEQNTILYFVKKSMPDSYQIPETIKTIGNAAFQGCSHFTKITLPENITTIENGVFSGCFSLCEINIPLGVTQIKNRTFSGCNSLKNIKLHDSIESIGDEAFRGCKFDKIDFPAKLKTIGKNAFKYCNNLIDIILPNQVEIIGEGAFIGCGKIRKLVLPKSIVSIGTNAFGTCEDRNTLIDKVYYQAEEPIDGSKDIFSKKAYEKTKLLCPYGFIDNYKATPPWAYFSIIEEYDFSLVEISDIVINPSETNILIGDNYKIQYEVLPGNASNKVLTWKTDDPNIVSVSQDGIATANGIGSTFIYASSTDGSDINASLKVNVLPVLVESLDMTPCHWSGYVGDEFQITPIIVPENATNKSVIWSSENPGIAKIDENGNVKTLSVGETTIWVKTKDGSNLKRGAYVQVKERLGESVTLNVSDTIIAEGETFNLTAIVLPENTTNKNIVWSSDDTSVVEVDNAGCVTAIQVGTATITANLKQNPEIFAKCNIAVIPGRGVYGKWEYQTLSKENRNVALIHYSGNEADIVVPDKFFIGNDSQFEMTVIQIGGTSNNIFENAELVESVELPNTLKYIGISAFSGCSSLKSITIPESVTAIGAEAFNECTSLSKVKFPNSVKSIGIQAFWGCSSLKFIDFGEGLETIGAQAFYGCRSIGAIYCRAVTPPSIYIKYDPSFSIEWATLFVPTDSYSDYLNSNWETVFFESIIGTDFIDRVEIDETEVNMRPNGHYRINGIIKPTSVGREWFFISSDESIATIDNSGWIHSHECGEAIITLKLVDSDISASCKVIVSEPIDSIAINPAEAIIEKGKELQLNLTILPDNATDKTIEWLSSDDTIATVNSDGLVTAVGIGECIITASAKDGSGVSASCSVTVNPVLIESISLDPAEWICTKGETLQINARILPENADDLTLTWSSGDESVAIVNSDGLVTAVGIGECIITASAKDGSGVSASCSVTVNPVLIESISLDPTEWNGVEGESFQITAIIMPDDAENKTIEWSSNDNNIATVDGEGLVSVIKDGTCIITAKTTDGSDLSAECIVISISGIDDIFTDADERFEIFNSHGLLIKYDGNRDDLKRLSPGIYIIRQGRDIRKMIIR